MTTPTQDTCGCCEGTAQEPTTPEYNRPGLDALAFRVGTHADFLERMQARLSAMVVPDGSGQRPLLRLTTRETSDASMALLDSFACVADVLTFYQERIANEGYLRTATERRSVLELARLIGYTLKPGVAATTYLAYTIDDNHMGDAVIEPGAKSQSIPAPGELPQTFETVEPLQARAQWNVLKPRLSQPQTLMRIQTQRALYLKGVSANLKPNDVLLVRHSDGADVFTVKDATPELAADRTKVTLVAAPANKPHDPAKVAAAYRAAVERALKQALDASPSGVTANKLVAVAKDALTAVTALPANANVAQIDALAANVMARLSAVTLPANATVVDAWRKTLVKALQDAQQDAQTGSPIHKSNAEQHNLANAAALSREKDELLSAMRGLSKPASIPPRNTLRLERALGQSFARHADGGLQVLRAVQPDVAANLPTALANVQATPALGLEVYAFRAQAGVYGATAPKHTINDDRGKVIGTVEWPIGGNQRIGIALSVAQSNPIPVLAVAISNAVRVQWQLGDGTSVTTTLQLKDGESVAGDIVNGSRTLHVEAGPINTATTTGIPVTIKGDGFDQQFLFKLGQSPTVSVETNGVADLTDTTLPTTPAIVLANQRRFDLVARQASDTFTVVGVVAESALPPTPRNVVALDAPVDGIAPETFALVQRHATTWIVATVQQSRTVSRNDYNFPAKVTELTLDQDWLQNELYLPDIRDTTVYAKSESLALADEPVTDAICGADEWIELDRLYSDLKPGRWLMVAGERADVLDAAGNTVPSLRSAELVMLDAVRHDVVKLDVAGAKVGEPLPGDSNHTYIKLARKLEYCYARDKITIYANVVKATHGETRDEPLGSGDGASMFQTFALKQSPLTFVPSLIPTGAETTLKVYVNNVRWHETDSLALSQPTDRHYITKTDDDARTTIVFGDGKHGSRLPTGISNVRAVYRQGIGKQGNVQPQQISLLLSRPLGVQAVTNPLRASGGADKENKDQARKNAPLAVTALDRLVSVQDYADFARSFAGIGKALAMRVSDGSRQVLHVTIAGADDIPIDPTSDLHQNLLRALREFGDADVAVRLAARELLLMAMQANVHANADYLWETVSAEIRRKLYDYFSFERRALGQDAVLSEAISVIQSVRGVAYVDVDAFGGIPEKIYDDAARTRRLLTPKEISGAMQQLLIEQGVLRAPNSKISPKPMRVNQRIDVNLALREGNSIRPAQLALLSPAAPDLLVINQIP